MKKEEKRTYKMHEQALQPLQSSDTGTESIGRTDVSHHAA